MAGDSTEANNEGEDVGRASPREILRNQAMDQESLLIIERALKRDQELRARFMREQEREYIDARDKRRTQLEETMLAQADTLKRDGIPESQLIPAIVENLFTQATPQEMFPDIAEELAQERNNLPLDDELRFFEVNAPEAFTKLDDDERERIVRTEAQFRDHNDLPPLSESISEIWGDPETRGKILKYGSYGVMAAVLIGSGGAAAPGMMASKVATRMMPHLAKAVDNASHSVGRALVRHGVIAPETHVAASEKMLALSDFAKTNKYLKAGKFALMGAVTMAASAAGADAAGLFDGFSADSATQAPDVGSTPDASSTGNGSATDTTKPGAGGESLDSHERADTPLGASTANAAEVDTDTGRRYTAPNVLDTSNGPASDFAPNVLDGSSGPERDWSHNVLDEATDNTLAANEATTDLPNLGASAANSVPTGELIQAMREAGLSTTQVEMFYTGDELSAEGLADIVELSENAVEMIQVLASQGVDVASLGIDIPENSAEPLGAEHNVRDLAMDPTPMPPIEVTVGKNDTLSDVIAEKLREQGVEVTSSTLYGDGAKPGLVEVIASHNPHISDPDLIYPGETVTLPMDVLHGKPMVEPALEADALSSSDDVVSRHDGIDPAVSHHPAVEGVNAQLADYELPPSSPGTEADMTGKGEVAGQEMGSGLRERLAGAMDRTKAFMASIGFGPEQVAENTTTGSSAPETPDVVGVKAEDRSNWDVLTEAAEKAKSEWGISQDVPGDTVTGDKEASEGPGTNDQGKPEQKQNDPSPVYARYNGSKGPGM